MIKDLILKNTSKHSLEQGLEQKTKETIIAMHTKNISLEDMSDITGKSKEEIKEIINSYQNE